MKYKNVKTLYNGVKFDSKKEAKRAFELDMLQRAGGISDLQRQVTYRLEVNGQLICKYIADFTFMKDGELIIEDVKSEFTKKLPVFRIKKKLLKAIYGYDIL